jgi:lysophospholipase L1-like esterase
MSNATPPHRRAATTGLVGRLALLLLGTALGLGAAETALRLLALVRPAEGLRALHEARPDRPWLFGLRPGAEARIAHTGDVVYTINAAGFRDRLYPQQKPPGTFRVVVMGDSIVFGYGVSLEDSFAKRLERALAARAGARPIEVLSLGVNGYNPYTEAALLADVGVRYQPDLVLVAFCINDLNDPTMHFDAQTVLRLGELPDLAFPDPAERRRPPPPSLAARLCGLSRLCGLLPGRASPLDPQALAAGLVSYDRPSATQLAWLRDRYGAMAATAARAGARFAAVVFPNSAQIDGKASDTVDREIAALGDAGGWQTIDLLPAFRRGRDTGPLFIDVWHPTAAGHRVAADALAAELPCRHLVPVPPGPDCP